MDSSLKFNIWLQEIRPGAESLNRLLRSINRLKIAFSKAVDRIKKQASYLAHIRLTGADALALATSLLLVILALYLFSGKRADDALAAAPASQEAAASNVRVVTVSLSDHGHTVAVAQEPYQAPEPPKPATPYEAGSPLAIGWQMNKDRFGEAEWSALYSLWMRESGWDPSSHNRRSGACGIPQALPCSKITDKSTAGQINWGMNYIGGRYGSPSKAWAHFKRRGWY